MKKFNAEKLFGTFVAIVIAFIGTLISVSSYAQTSGDFNGGYKFMLTGADKANFVKKVAKDFDVKISNTKKGDPVTGFYIKNDTKDSLGVFVAVTEDDLKIDGVSADPSNLYNIIVTKAKERLAVTAKKDADKEAKKIEAAKKKAEREAKKAEREAKAEAKRQERIAKGLPAEPQKKGISPEFKAVLN